MLGTNKVAKINLPKKVVSLYLVGIDEVQVGSDLKKTRSGRAWRVMRS